MLARILSIVLIIIAVILFLVFKSSLHLDPRQLPSVKINQSIPEFQLTDLMHEQKKIEKKNLLGHPTVLNIWATWCEACLIEHPLFLQLATEYHDRVQFIGLNYKDDPLAAKKWLQANGNPYQTVMIDPTGTFAIDLGVYITPETFLLDKKGIILFRHVGPLTMEVWQKEFLPRLNA